MAGVAWSHHPFYRSTDFTPWPWKIFPYWYFTICSRSNLHKKLISPSFNHAVYHSIKWKFTQKFYIHSKTNFSDGRESEKLFWRKRNSLEYCRSQQTSKKYFILIDKRPQTWTLYWQVFMHPKEDRSSSLLGFLKVLTLWVWVGEKKRFYP